MKVYKLSPPDMNISEMLVRNVVKYKNILRFSFFIRIQNMQGHSKFDYQTSGLYGQFPPKPFYLFCHAFHSLRAIFLRNIYLYIAILKVISRQENI